MNILSEVFSDQSRNCSCAVPCERVRYEPSLSYAQLSEINVVRLVADSDEKKTQLQVPKWHGNFFNSFKDKPF